MRALRYDSPFALVAPLVVWGAHLLFVYVVHAIDCARHPETGAVTLPVLWLASGLAVLALAGFATVQYRLLRRGRCASPVSDDGRVPCLVLRTGPLLCLMALAGVVWAAMAIGFVPACA